MGFQADDDPGTGDTPGPGESLPDLLAAFEHGGKREHGQREPAVARPGCARMEEDNHWLALLAT